MTELELLPGCAMALPGGTWREVLEAMTAQVIAQGHALETFGPAVIAREERFPTGLPTPVPSAIPHSDPQHVLHAGVAVAALASPVDFAEMGGGKATVAARLVVMLCMTDGQAQVGALQTVLARLRDEAGCLALLQAAQDDPDQLEPLVRDWLSG